MVGGVARRTGVGGNTGQRLISIPRVKALGFMLEEAQMNEEQRFRRRIEVFTADCPCCAEAVELVQRIACPSCRVEIRDMRDPDTARRAGKLGVRSVPAVALDGVLAGCCAGRGPQEEALRAAGVGQDFEAG